MDEPLFSHPHDHFRLRHAAVVPNTCFVLMPFEERFTIVYQTIVKALRGLMVCTRADDLRLGKPILERIINGIRSSELIVADLTGRNPNVFYELGLAHTNTKNVLLLAQNIEEVPFDLRGLYCHNYSTHSLEELERLEVIVKAAAEDVRSHSIPAMLQGAVTRTQQIVEHMERVLAFPSQTIDRVIRQQAGFSTIANVGYDDSKDQQKREYGKWLDKERDLLIRWEIPRLCRGGSRSLTAPGVCFTHAISTLCQCVPTWRGVGFGFDRLRSGPFEGPAAVKPPALPEDTYSNCWRREPSFRPSFTLRCGRARATQGTDGNNVLSYSSISSVAEPA